MLAINCIAIIGAIAMLACYKPLCNYLRGNYAAVSRGNSKKNDNTKGKKNYHYTGKSKKKASYGASVSSAQEENIGFSIFVALFIVALLVRLVAAAMYKGNETDMNCFISWADMVYGDGFKNFYLSDAFHDYPPGYMYILYVIGAIRSIFGIAWDSVLSIVLTKMPAIIADMVTGYLLYKISRKYIKESGAAIVAGLYMLCPAVILDSAVWGQTDSVFTLFMVLMCYLITEEKLVPSYFVFAIGILIKPQSLILTPVLICGIVDQVFLKDFNWNKFFKNLIPGLVAILMIGVLMLPYGFNEALSQYTSTLSSYEYASVNAYNIWTMFGLNWASQYGTFMGVTYQHLGTAAIILIVVISIYISIRCKNSRGKYYFIGAFIVTCVFMFAVRMHDRYLFPAMVLLLLAFASRLRKELYYLYILICTVAFYNMAHVQFVYDVNNFDAKAVVPIMIAIGLLASTIYMIYVAYKLYGHKVTDVEDTEVIARQVPRQSRGMKDDNPIKKLSVLHKMVKIDFIALGIIMLIYGVIAFVRLGNMSAPETSYSLVQSGAITLDMGQDVAVGQMWDYLGYKNNPTYYIEYTSDINGEWTTLCGEGSEWDAGAVFCWNSKDINVTARYFRISPSATNTEDSMMELVFTDTSGNMLMPVNSSDYANLFDEQDMFDGRASNMNGTYFDEIYHARTAYEMIHHLYCYENTHPPLGKILIACGVLIFGMNPFGWRFMGTLFGVLMIPIIYNFAKKFFGETWICIVTTLLFAFDFMHFVQTRIATIDVFVTLFIMLSYYFMYCYTKYNFYDTNLKKTFIPLGLCGIAMGLSWASKWTGIYSSAGLCIIFFIQMYRRFSEYIYAAKHPNGKTDGIEHEYITQNFYKLFFKTIGFCCIFFIVVPAVIYILSYIPFSDGTDRGLISRMIVAQKTMYDYHSNLNATHPYSSTWYQWPIMYRPMWYYSGVVSDTLREGISAFGNPLVWWAGIPASLYMLYLMFKQKDRKAGFLVIGYLSQYAPWFMVTRVVFIYHYFPSVPFITVMLGYSMYRFAKWKPKLKPLVYVYVALAIGLFILFYPVLSGLAISPDFATKYLKWFESWVLLQTW